MAQEAGGSWPLPCLLWKPGQSPRCQLRVSFFWLHYMGLPFSNKQLAQPHPGNQPMLEHTSFSPSPSWAIWWPLEVWHTMGTGVGSGKPHSLHPSQKALLWFPPDCQGQVIPYPRRKAEEPAPTKALVMSVFPFMAAVKHCCGLRVAGTAQARPCLVLLGVHFYSMNWAKPRTSFPLYNSAYFQ